MAFSPVRTLKYGPLADQLGDLWLPEDPEGDYRNWGSTEGEFMVNVQSETGIVCVYIYINVYMYIKGHR